ncbi:hypothetical protein BSNK01_10200 [Bacillaceae bacterium]
MKGTKAYLGLGSNLGDRRRYLCRALAVLDEHPQVELTRVSSIYETEPVGFTEQPPFLNLVAEIVTTLSPRELLAAVQAVERGFGRTREVKWGPRTLDIDILYYGKETIRSDDLVIPHPHIPERAFVVLPLLEIVGGDFRLPDGTLLREVYAAVPGKEGVRKVESVKSLHS